MENIYFIDNHIHGSYGINFNFASYEEIRFLLKEFYKRNIRGICPTLVGDKKENIIRQLSIFKQIQNEQRNEIKDECYIIGVHLEGTFLSKDKAGIQDKSTFLAPTITNFKSITEGFEDVVKIVTIAPEDDVDLIDYLNEKNILTQAGHTVGSDIKSCKATTHHFNAMNPIHHRNPSVALSGLVRDDIYIEVIADLVHLSSDILKLIYKAKPLDKILLVSDSLPSSNSDSDIIFCNKKINKFGCDETGTLAGSNMTLDTIAKNLAQKNIFKVDEIKQMVFDNQIKYLNLKDIEIDILKR